MRILVTFILILLTSVALEAQIGANPDSYRDQQGKIYGTWQNNDFGYQMTLMLNANGSGEFDGDAITFTTQADKLTIRQNGETNIYTFTLQGNSMTISGGDLDQAITFTKSGSSGQVATEVKAPAGKTSAAVALIGSWSGHGESIEFKNNGQCTYLGQIFPYSVAGNIVTLQTSQGNVPMGYAISGDQLTLTVNGQSIIYAKGKAGSNAPQAQGKSTGNHALDMSLVGKWCYINVTSTNSGGSSTDACITINGDGTYSYYSERSMSANTSTFSSGTASQNSDSGTWWVDGNRIYYNSQTQGQGSYELVKQNHPKNGDPMIVLDGTSYVTYFQKSPW